MAEILSESRINKRQQALLAQIRNQGSGQVESLADQFQVTPQTIRRDLNILCDRRLLRRVHGGAVAPEGGDQGVPELANLDYATRTTINPNGKALVGRLTEQIIPNDASMFINIGTTTELVAEHLTEHTGLLVRTNNINIVNHEIGDNVHISGTLNKGTQAMDFDECGGALHAIN